MIRTGALTPKDADTAREARRSSAHRASPFDLWAATVDGTVQVAIGTTLHAAVLFPGDVPLRTRRLAVAAHVPASAGSLLVGLYRVDPLEHDSDGITARLSAQGSAELSASATPERVVVDLDREVVIDRGQAMWLIACVGTAAAVSVAAADEQTCNVPCFTAATGELPGILVFGRTHPDGVELSSGQVAVAARCWGRAASRLA